MNLDRQCACGCRTLLIPGTVVLEVGVLRYAQACVRMVMLEPADEKIPHVVTDPLGVLAPVVLDPSAVKV